MNELPQKVLFVMEEGVGNMVVATPGLIALKSALGENSEIWVYGKEPALSILTEAEFITGVLHETDEGLPKDFKADVLLASLWSGRFMAKHTDDKLKGRFGMRIVAQLQNLDAHESEYHLDFARHFGWQGQPPDPYVYVKPFDIKGRFGSNPYVVICDTAANEVWERKRWGGYPRLAEMLLMNTDFSVILVGGKYERENFDLSVYPDPESHRLTTAFDLELGETAYLLKNAALVLGNDSGPIHMAAAVNAPTFGIFGPTRITKNRPIGEKVWTLRKEIGCGPCQYTSWWDTCRVFECMQIPAETVYDHAINLQLTNENHKVVNEDIVIPSVASKTPQKLAAVIRHKDQKDWIVQCLQSVERVADLILIVDNGSTDGSLEYIQERANITEKYRIEYTQGLDEPRDRAVMQQMLTKARNEDGITWGLFIDGDEVLEDRITRELVQQWINDDTTNAYKLRHVHFWGTIKKYRVDQRWKPRFNRILWRLTPEATIETTKHVHPAIVERLKGPIKEVDYVVKHFGHVDWQKNLDRYKLYKSIDNEDRPDWTGRTYEHMVNTDVVELETWREGGPYNWGRPSMLIPFLHAMGDALMLTPTLEELKRHQPELEISLLVLGETKERDFKVREIFETNPNVKAVIDAEIDYHPRWWNQELYLAEDEPKINAQINKLMQATSYDNVYYISLQDNRELHRIHRAGATFGLKINNPALRIYPTVADKRWATQTVFEFLNKRGQNDKLISGNPAESKLISVHHFCGHEPKSWGWEKCKKLCQMLTLDGHLVVLWDNDPREWFNRPKIALPGVLNMRDYADQLTVNKAASVMALCDLHVGADSFPMHLASACQIPLVAIFEKTIVTETCPLHSGSVILGTTDCLTACPISFLEQNAERLATGGVTEISVNEAYSVVNRMIHDKVTISDKLAEVKIDLVPGFSEPMDFDVLEMDRDNFDGWGTHSERTTIRYLTEYLWKLAVESAEGSRRNDGAPSAKEIVFYDVGAGYGFYSSYVLNPQNFPFDSFDISCYAFEPNPFLRPALHRNADRHNTANRYISIYGEAVGADPDDSYLTLSPRQGLVGFVTPTKGYMSIPCCVERLDTLIEQYNMKMPDIIKIDVEGGEIDVMLGAEKALEHAKLVIVEAHIGVNSYATLQHYGFQIQAIGARHILGVKPPLKIPGYAVNTLLDPEELHLFADYLPPMDTLLETLPDIEHNALNWFELMPLFREFGNRQDIFGSLPDGTQFRDPLADGFQQRNVVCLDMGTRSVPYLLALLGHHVVMINRNETAFKRTMTRLENSDFGEAVNAVGGKIESYHITGNVDASHYWADWVLIFGEHAKQPDDKDLAYLIDATDFLKPDETAIMLVQCPFGQNPVPGFRVYDETTLTERLIDPMDKAGFALRGHSAFDNVDLTLKEYLAYEERHTAARLVFGRK